MSIQNTNAEACPRISTRKSSSVQAAEAGASVLTVSISENGIFRSRVVLPDTATGECTTRLYSRLRREDDSRGDIKRIHTKVKTGKTVQFRAFPMPGVSRSGERAPTLTFFAETQCLDADLSFSSNLEAVFLDCGASDLAKVLPSEFVRLLRKIIR